MDYETVGLMCVDAAITIYVDAGMFQEVLEWKWIRLRILQRG